MNREELKNLFNLDLKPFENNQIDTNLLSQFDEYLFCCLDDYSLLNEVLSVYKKFVSMKQEAPQGMKNELFSTIRNFAKSQIDNSNLVEALILYRFLIVKSELFAEDYANIAECIAKLGNNDLACIFINLYKIKEENKPLMFISVANFYNLLIKDYKTAITYYEKYIEIDKTKVVIYTILANLYKKVYGDDRLKDQIFYLLKANSLKPNDRLILHGLAFGYEKLEDFPNAKKYYDELLLNNPTSIDYYNYGLFLIHNGQMSEGHKYFTYRFLIDDENLKYPVKLPNDKKWDFKSNISDKTLLVHYEQGFGDTFMYCRFIPQLKNFAKKVIFIVQDNLFELIKTSFIISDGIEIVSDKNCTGIQYDYSIALLDVPYVVGIDKDTLPFSDGYLDIDGESVKKYADKYLNKNNKIKIGIVYSGDKNANYHGRDIDISKFKPITEVDNVEVYSLQYGESELFENVINLGNTFDSFTDTACAIKNMDLIVTTDNVILNLAGALGVNTIGLFNKYTNFRWYKTNGNNVGWYESVKPIQAKSENDWGYVFAEVVKYINATF